MMSTNKCRQCGKEGVTGSTGPFCSAECLSNSVKTMFEKTFGPGVEVKAGKVGGMNVISMEHEINKPKSTEDECDAHRVEVEHLTWESKLVDLAKGMVLLGVAFGFGWCACKVATLVATVEALQAAK